MSYRKSNGSTSEAATCSMRERTSIRCGKPQVSLDTVTMPRPSSSPEQPSYATAATSSRTVLDLFESDGKSVAVLDTTVNHMPEVFEYQFRPDVLGHQRRGWVRVRSGGHVLSGGRRLRRVPVRRAASCRLARSCSPDAGAYTIVKANTFNGIPLPTVYELRDDGQFHRNGEARRETFRARAYPDSDGRAYRNARRHPPHDRRPDSMTTRRSLRFAITESSRTLLPLRDRHSRRGRVFRPFHVRPPSLAAMRT